MYIQLLLQAIAKKKTVTGAIAMSHSDLYGLGVADAANSNTWKTIS
jgi:hypothetical protein